MVLALIIVRNERTVPCTPMEPVTNSNTSRLGSQRANTETWTKSSSQNSVATAAAPPTFTATPRRLCLTLRWRRQWRGGRSGPPWPSANALAGVCTSSPAPNVIDIVYVHGGRGRRRRVEVAAADSFEPRNTGRQTDSSSLHSEKFARFWFHPFFSFFSLDFSAHYWLLNTPGKLVVSAQAASIFP